MYVYTGMLHMWRDVISRKKKRDGRLRAPANHPRFCPLILPPFAGRSPPAFLLSHLRVPYPTHARMPSFLCVAQSARTQSCRRRRPLQAFFSSTFLPPYPRCWCAQVQGHFGTHRAGFIWEVYPDLSPPRYITNLWFQRLSFLRLSP